MERRRRERDDCEQQSNQTTREKQGTQQQISHGSGFEGQNRSEQKISASERKRIPNPQPMKNESQNPKTETIILEAKDRRGGGAHGPPRALHGSILGVLNTEEIRDLPCLRSRPQDSKNHSSITTKMLVP